jgi:hypothetical protein
MHAPERVGKGRPGIPLAPAWVDPFRKSQQAGEALADRLS